MLVIVGVVASSVLLGRGAACGARNAAARTRAARLEASGSCGVGGCGRTVVLPHWMVGAAALGTSEVVRLMSIVGGGIGLGGIATLVAPRGPALAALVVAAGVAGPIAWLRARRDAQLRRYELGVSDVLSALARSLRSGATLPVALADAAAVADAPLAGDVAAVAAAVAGGASMVDALQRWSVGRPTIVVRWASALLSIGANTGGLDARTTDQVAEVIRRRAASADDLRAASAQARASVLLLAVAPLAVLIALVALDAGAAEFVGSLAGTVCVGVGVLLDLMAVAWMRQIVRTMTAGATR